MFYSWVSWVGDPECWSLASSLFSPVLPSSSPMSLRGPTLPMSIHVPHPPPYTSPIISLPPPPAHPGLHVPDLWTYIFSKPKSKEQIHVNVLCGRKLLFWVKCFSGPDGSLAMALVDQTIINSVFEVQGWGEVRLGSSLWKPLGPMCDPHSYRPSCGSAW